MVNPELKKQLMELSDDDFAALKAKIESKIGGIGRVGNAVVAGAEAAGKEARRLLPTQLSILQGRNIPVTEEDSTDLSDFTAKEIVKRRIAEQYPEKETPFEREKFEFEKTKLEHNKYTPDEISSIIKQLSDMGDSIPPGTTIKLGDFTIPLNPKLTQEQAASIAASTEVEDDVNSLKDLLSKNEGSPGIIAKTKLPYWMIGGDTEEIKRLRDQLAARIPFAKGGKQLTPFEAKTLFVLLPQPGQELVTIDKNLDKFVREFSRMSEIAKKGTAGTKEVLVNQGVTATGMKFSVE